MDGRRRKKQQPPPPKKISKNPQTKIKELKKDIETFETEVNHLLEHVQVGSIDSICIVCENPIRTTEYHDLPCQHVLCETCAHDQITNHHPIRCPKCSQQQNPFFVVRSLDSSSSEDS